MLSLITETVVVLPTSAFVLVIALAIFWGCLASVLTHDELFERELRTILRYHTDRREMERQEMERHEMEWRRAYVGL